MNIRCNEQRGISFGSDDNLWRTDPCGTQADTYIEWRFEQQCKRSKSGCNILNEWYARKGEYVARLKTIAFDFQHYSRHDASHSINILESIYMLLGKDRIDCLSRGDLWLLLESAYYHDMGMVLTYERMIEIWDKDIQFKEYLRDCLWEEDEDERKAANLYFQMNNLIHNKEQMEQLNDEKINFNEKSVWMLDVQNALFLLMSGYVRRGHAKSAKYFFNDERVSYIPSRLYKVVLEVCQMHGESNYEKIITELKYCTKGVDSMTLHPRFAAAMLRMGDLLDMDNNRFEPKIIEHFGNLPYKSKIHYGKHCALTHLAIRTDRIEAEALSDDYDVCKASNDWFQSLKEEEGNLIHFWSEIAPEHLRGCLLGRGSYIVYFKNKDTIFKENIQNNFSVDKGKFIELVVGSNIYNGKFEFYREYLQNALDASKMRMWLDLKRDTYHYGENPQVSDRKKMTPLDIADDIYDRYMIDVKIDLDMSSQKVKLSISDRGIGMDEECLKAIAVIGSGWREKEVYKRNVRDAGLDAPNGRLWDWNTVCVYGYG